MNVKTFGVIVMSHVQNIRVINFLEIIIMIMIHIYVYVLFRTSYVMILIMFKFLHGFYNRKHLGESTIFLLRTESGIKVGKSD